MVRRLNSVPSFVGRPHGPYHVHPPSPIGTPTTLHSRVLWLYRIDTILCYRRTSLPPSHTLLGLYANEKI